MEKFNGKLQFWGGISRRRVNFWGRSDTHSRGGVRLSLTSETQGRIPKGWQGRNIFYEFYVKWVNYKKILDGLLAVRIHRSNLSRP